MALTRAQMIAIVNSGGSVVWPPIGGTALTTVAALPTDAQILSYFSGLAAGQTLVIQPNLVLPGVIAANGDTVAVLTSGYGHFSLDIQGTFNGTLVTEYSTDGATWRAMNLFPLSDLTNAPGVSSIVNNGAFNNVYDGGLTNVQQIRVRASAWTSGSANIVINLTPYASIVKMRSAIPAGANTIGNISQVASQSASSALQSAAVATGNGTPFTILGMSAVIFTVTGTFVGTVIFEGTEDGANYSALSTSQLGASVIGSTAIAPGLFEASVAGLQNVRARVSAYTSGSMTVTAHAVPLPFNTRMTSTTLNTLISGEDQTNNVLKVEERFSPITPITTATTTVLKSGAGFCHNLRVAGGALGNVTVYDSLTASGTILFPTITPIQGQLLIEDVMFGTGLTVVTAAATAVVGSIR